MSERLGIYSEVELGAARDLVRELVRVVRSHRLYEESHPALADMVRSLRKRWDVATAAGPLSLRFQDRRILLADESVYTSTSDNEVVPSALYDHGVVGLVLKRGIDPSELRRLVQVLTEQPDTGHGHDYASLLWEADLKHVQVLLDADEDDEWDAAARDPALYAQEVERMSEPGDPPAGGDYTAERAVEPAPAGGEEADGEDGGEGPSLPELDEAPATDRFTLTDSEKKIVATEVETDRFESTIQHALRIVHALAREDQAVEDAETLERSIGSLTASLCGTGMLEAVLAAGERALELASTGHDLSVRAGEATLDCLRQAENLWTLLSGLEFHEYVDMRRLGEFFVMLGAETAPTVAEWLTETRHGAVATHAVRVYGEAAVDALVPVYRTGSAGTRERIAPILLDLGTEQALQALTDEFARLPESTRLTVVGMLARNTAAHLRRVLLEALSDESDRVRRAARGALKKQDADSVADVFARFLESGEFERRPAEEIEDFFEMLSRIGNGRVAKLLAQQCEVRGFTFGRRKLTELQRFCVRALRRMRSSEARPVVEELRAHGPKPVRELLDEVW